MRTINLCGKMFWLVKSLFYNQTQSIHVLLSLTEGEREVSIAWEAWNHKFKTKLSLLTVDPRNSSFVFFMSNVLFFSPSLKSSGDNEALRCLPTKRVSSSFTLWHGPFFFIWSTTRKTLIIIIKTFKKSNLWFLIFNVTCYKKISNSKKSKWNYEELFTHNHQMILLWLYVFLIKSNTL